MSLRRSYNEIFWYLNNLTSRIVAKSGIPSDRFHLGKIILANFKDAPSFMTLIDGATGQFETNESMLEKSIHCAISMRYMGLQKGDVVVLMAPTHTQLSVPFFAALYLGIIIAPVDTKLGVAELQKSFLSIKPKIIFSQAEKVSEIKRALDITKTECKIVTFDNGDGEIENFEFFLSKYKDETAVKDFQANDFDAENSIGFLIPTSGSTGLPKTAALTYKNVFIQAPQLWKRCIRFPTPTQTCLVCSPIQWLTAVLGILMSAILRFTLLQTSGVITVDHIVHLLNTYKPTSIISSPTLMTSLLKSAHRETCDFSNIEIVKLGGSAVPQTLVDEVKKVMPKADVVNIYGATEMSGMGFDPDYPAPGSNGKPMRTLQYRFINPDTNEDIEEPNMPGELWVKGPAVFKEYYNEPVATKDAFTEDGWFKSGDLFYRDEHYNFFFVDRIKLLLKYKNHQISPQEIENVIRQHPNVADVAVIGIPDPENGDLPVAFVVPRKGFDITAKEIEDIVQDSMSDSKRLRGGVIFLDQLPLNPSMKVHRNKLKEMARCMKKE